MIAQLTFRFRLVHPLWRLGPVETWLLGSWHLGTLARSFLRIPSFLLFLFVQSVQNDCQRQITGFLSLSNGCIHLNVQALKPKQILHILVRVDSIRCSLHLLLIAIFPLLVSLLNPLNGLFQSSLSRIPHLFSDRHVSQFLLLQHGLPLLQLQLIFLQLQLLFLQLHFKLLLLLQLERVGLAIGSLLFFELSHSGQLFRRSLFLRTFLSVFVKLVPPDTDLRFKFRVRIEEVWRSHGWSPFWCSFIIPYIVATPVCLSLAAANLVTGPAPALANLGTPLRGAAAATGARSFAHGSRSYHGTS